MALQFLSYIYGIDSAGGQTEITAAGGQANTFASNAVHIYPTTAVRGQAQVTCASIVEVPATGNNQISTKYYSAETVAALQTKANA